MSDNILDIICKECHNLLQEDTSTGELVFRCPTCGETYETNDAQTLIEEENLESEDQINNFGEFIDNAAFDATNERIDKECNMCKRPFMTPVRIGENQTVFFVCICGNKQKN